MVERVAGPDDIGGCSLAKTNNLYVCLCVARLKRVDKANRVGVALRVEDCGSATGESKRRRAVDCHFLAEVDADEKGVSFDIQSIADRIVHGACGLQAKDAGIDFGAVDRWSAIPSENEFARGQLIDVVRTPEQFAELRSS